jgi:hypothetical protein
MKKKLSDFLRKYFEALVFAIALLLLGLMDPNAANGFSLCLFEQLGISFCPGDGLGHSISYIFRGDIYNALESNILGPFAILVLGGRVLHLIIKNCYNTKINI